MNKREVDVKREPEQNDFLFQGDVKHEPEQLRKMFIGGLDYSTTDEGLKAFYEKWGTVVDVVVMKDPKTRRSRGFGFITYSRASMVDDAMNNRPHKIDGRQVEPKRAVPRDLCNKGEANVRKLFIGGIGKLTTKEDLEEYFKKYGTLTDCAIVVTKDTGEPRGFGFVEFEDVDSADKVILIRDHEIKGRRVEIKKAIARDEINKDNRRGGRGIRDSRGGGDFRNGQGNYGAWNGQGNNWGINGPSPWSNQQGSGGNNPYWGGNNAWGNNSCWGNNQNGYPGNYNDMGNLGNMGMNSGMNNMGGGGGGGGGMNSMGNMGGNMGNMGNMSGNMGGNMGGNMTGGGLSNMGGGMNNVGGGMNNMGGALGGSTSGGMGGAVCSLGGGAHGGNNMYGSNMGGSMGFNNFGGPSGGGPMRGGYGSNNRPAPYPTSGGMNDRRKGGGKYHLEKSGGRREGNRPVRF